MDVSYHLFAYEFDKILDAATAKRNREEYKM